MCTVQVPSVDAANDSPLHAKFLSIMPKIRRHGQFVFRHVKCPSKRDDAVAEMVSLSWKWFRRLAEKGQDGRQFPTALASYAARAVYAGRRLCGQENSKDALSPLAQKRRGFAVQALPDFRTLASNPLEEALADNTVTPVDEQVAFRLDFPRWLSNQGERTRAIATALMCGERTMDVSNMYGVSQGTISRMRGQLRQSWERFSDTPEPLEARRAC